MSVFICKHCNPKSPCIYCDRDKNTKSVHLIRCPQDTYMSDWIELESIDLHMLLEMCLKTLDYGAIITKIDKEDSPEVAQLRKLVEALKC